MCLSTSLFAINPKQDKVHSEELVTTAGIQHVPHFRMRQKGKHFVCGRKKKICTHNENLYKGCTGCALRLMVSVMLPLAKTNKEYTMHYFC